MYTYSWCQWLLFFYIYCFFGWIFESAYVSLKERRFVNRGFLRLPMLPLYGTGAVMMLWVSLPVKDSMFLVYVLGVIAATILEYVTGYGMELLFKMKYWDYSNHRFQLHGYICLTSSIAWGFLTILLTEYIHKPIERSVLLLHPFWNLTVVLFITAFFLADFMASTKEAFNLGRVLESLTKIRTELEDLQVQLFLLKAETAKKVTDYKEDTTQKVNFFKDEAVLKVQRLVEFSEDTVQKVATGLPDSSALTERLHALLERRKHISEHISFYHKSILRGNPSAGSNRFNDALKELKDYVQNRKN